MNPSKRSSFEDCSIYAPAGSWNAPDENMAILAVVDGHGGRDIVEFLEDGLVYHVSHELQIEHNDPGNCDGNNISNETIPSNGSIPERLERAFLMADIHSKAIGLTDSGATVAVCLVTRGNNIYDNHATRNQMNDTDDNENIDNTWTIYAANAGDARIVVGHQGVAHRMTRDHKTDDPEEVRRIEESGGFVFKGRVLGILAVTRSLGDHCMKEYVSNRAMCYCWTRGWFCYSKVVIGVPYLANAYFLFRSVAGNCNTTYIGEDYIHHIRDRNVFHNVSCAKF